MTDQNKLVFEADSSKAVTALGQLKAAATDVKRALSELNAASPTKAVGEMAQFANSMIALNDTIIKNFATLEKAIQSSGTGAAAAAKRAGKETSKAMADGLREGDEAVQATMRAKTQQLQTWFETQVNAGWKFQESALARLKSQGVNLGPELKGEAFKASLLSGSATKMSEDDVRHLLGMPDRGAMKSFAASLKSRMQEDLQQAKVVAKYTDDDPRALLGLPSREAMSSFAAALKNRMQEDMQRARSASKMTEDDIRSLLGMPDRGAMKSFAASLKSRMQEDLDTVKLRAKSASKFTEEDTRALLGMPSLAEMSGFSAALKSSMLESVALEKANKDLDASKAKLAATAGVTGAAFRDLKGHANDLHSAARGLASGFNAMWLTWGNLVPLLAGAAVSNAFMQSIKVGAEFQGTITAIGELAGVSAAELQQLSDAALTIGSSSQYGPLEMAKGLKTLALAGLDAKQQLAAIKPVMNFATAGEMNLDKAAESLTAISTAFGYQADGLGAVADVIAKSAAVSMSSVGDMTEAFRQASTVAQQFGVSVTDASTVLALLSQVGIKGSAAGTSMRNMYNELLGSSKQARDVLTKYLGVDIIDNSTKSVKDLTTIFRDLGKALSGYDFESQLRLLQAMGNERGGKAIAATLTAAVTEIKKSGGDISTVLAELQQKLADAPGFVAQAAIGMALTAENQIKSVGNALQGALIRAFQDAQPTVLAVANDLRAVFNSPEFLAGLKTIVEGVAKLIGFLVRNIDLIAAVASGLAIGTTAMLAFNAATAVATVVLPALGTAIGVLSGGATVALGAMAAAFWPVTLALGAVAAAWYVFGRESEDANQKALKASQQSVKAVLDGMAEEERRLTEQIRLRREGTAGDQIAAAARTSLAEQEMMQNHKVERSYAQLAHTKLLTARAGLDPSVGVEIARAAYLDKQIEASRNRIADLVVGQTNSEANFSEQVRRVKNLARQDSVEAAAAAAAARNTPTGSKVFTPSVGSTGKVSSLPRDSELQAIQKQLNDQESVLKTAYDSQRRLLDLDHQYKLVSEGEYQAKVLAETAKFEADRAKLRIDARIDYESQYRDRLDEADELAQSGKMDASALEQAKKNLATERATFMAAMDAADAKDALATNERRAAAMRVAAGTVREAGLAVDAYVLKINRELEAESELLAVKRAHAEDTPEQRARYEASAAFVAKHAGEVAGLAKKAKEAGEELVKFEALLPKDGRTDEMVSALENYRKTAASAQENLNKLQAAVDAGASRAGANAAEALRDQSDALKGARAGFIAYRDTANSVFESVKSMVVRASNTMTEAILKFTKTGKLDFSDMVESMIDDITRLMIQKNITSPLADKASGALGGVVGGLLGGTGGGGGGIFGSLMGGLGNLFGGSGASSALFSIGSFFGLAKGGAFEAGGVRAFASGGAFTNSLVASPTMFNHAGGLGLMGEAGPEAVMPLTRAADGSLGVRAPGANRGGGDVHITQHITIDSRSDQATIMAAMNQAKEMAKAEILKSRRAGGVFA